MTLAKLTPWLRLAQAQTFAIGAFNINTLEQVQAIVQAAQAECAPVILQVSHRALNYLGVGQSMIGIRYIAEIGRVAAESVSVPVVLHLDHGSYEEVLSAISLGFTSVMFDGGDLPYDDNVTRTQELRELTSSLGINLEAELGVIGRVGGLENDLTNPDDVADFVEKTHVDSLAVSIGSVHGGQTKTTVLDLDRLAAIHAVTDVPLVLHGSSGVRDEDIQAAIGLGLCKINVSTQLNQAFTQAVRNHLAADVKVVDPRPYLGAGRTAMQAAVQERMRFFGVAGRAQPA